MEEGGRGGKRGGDEMRQKERIMERMKKQTAHHVNPPSGRVNK